MSASATERSRLGRVASTESSPNVRAMPSTAAAAPCGRLRTMSKSVSSTGTSVSPRKTRRKASICCCDSADKLATVRLRMRLPSRHASRSNTAGGEPRLGITSINMAT